MKKTTKLFALAFVLLASQNAKAADDAIYLNLGGFSKHFKERKGNKDYNDVHNNIGIEYERNLNLDGMYKDLYWGGNVQYMKNSLDNDSIAAGGTLKKRWKITEDVGAAVGGVAGLQNGYPSNDRSKNTFVPVAYPVVEANYKRVGVYGTCVPEVYASGFCFAGFKFKVNP